METVVPLAIFVSSGFVFPAIAKTIQARLQVDPEVTRKGYHMVSGAFVVGALAIVPNVVPFVIAISLFVVLMPVMAWAERKKTGAFDDRILGPFYFTLAQLVLVVAAFDDKPVIVAAILVTAFADAAAALVGRKYGRRPYEVLGSSKSIEGSAAFFAVAFLAVSSTLAIYRVGDLPTVLLIAAVCALFATLVESISVKATDNLTVTLLTAFVLHLLLGNGAERMPHLLLAIPLFGALFVACHRLRIVDGPAAVASFLVSALAYGVGGWRWIVPIATFFFSASIVTKLVSRVYANPFDARSTKDLWQALANGLTPLAAVIGYQLTRDPSWFFAYLGILAAQTSDAMSSEIGGLSRSALVYSLPTLRKVPKGMSGGVTVLGTAAGVAGAALIALCTLLAPGRPALLPFAAVLGAGLLGNVVDSVLGGTVQVRNRCTRCGATVESDAHCPGAGVERVAGVSWMTNDTVNFLKGVFSGVAAAAAVTLLGAR